MVELFLFADHFAASRPGVESGRIVPVLRQTVSHRDVSNDVELYVRMYLRDFDLFLSAPSCSMSIIVILLNSHHGEWANSSPSPNQITTDCEPENTASQMGLEIAFHRSLLLTFLLCHIRALITTSLSPGCGRPWIRGPHLSLRVNELAPPPPNSVLALLKKQNDSS